MTIDNAPAILAYVRSRKAEIEKQPSSAKRDGQFLELDLIEHLCEGLAKQQEMIYDAFGGAGRLVER